MDMNELAGRLSYGAGKGPGLIAAMKLLIDHGRWLKNPWFERYTVPWGSGGLRVDFKHVLADIESGSTYVSEDMKTVMVIADGLAKNCFDLSVALDLPDDVRRLVLESVTIALNVKSDPASEWKPDLTRSAVDTTDPVRIVEMLWPRYGAYTAKRLRRSAECMSYMSTYVDNVVNQNMWHVSSLSTFHSVLSYCKTTTLKLQYIMEGMERISTDVQTSKNLASVDGRKPKESIHDAKRSIARAVPHFRKAFIVLNDACKSISCVYEE